MRRLTSSSLGRCQLACAPATRLLGSRFAQVARAAAVLSFGTAAVTAHCVGGTSQQDDLAKKLQEIQEMKRAIEQREREASHERERERAQREDEVEDDFDEDGHMDEADEDDTYTGEPNFRTSFKLH